MEVASIQSKNDSVLAHWSGMAPTLRLGMISMVECKMFAAICSLARTVACEFAILTS